VARVQDSNHTKEKSSKPSKSSTRFEKNVANTFSVGGLLGGLSNLIEKLGELAETGEELSRSGELTDSAGKVHGVYGINVRTALGDQGQTELKVEPFGNVRRREHDAPPGDDVREPLVDVHEENDHVLVVVELPGVAKENVDVKVADGHFNLCAHRGKTTYRKEFDLPENCSAQHMSWECNNGILKVKFER